MPQVQSQANPAAVVSQLPSEGWVVVHGETFDLSDPASVDKLLNELSDAELVDLLELVTRAAPKSGPQPTLRAVGPAAPNHEPAITLVTPDLGAVTLPPDDQSAYDLIAADLPPDLIPHPGLIPPASVLEDENGNMPAVAALHAYIEEPSEETWSQFIDRLVESVGINTTIDIRGLLMRVLIEGMKEHNENKRYRIERLKEANELARGLSNYMQYLQTRVQHLASVSKGVDKPDEVTIPVDVQHVNTVSVDDEGKVIVTHDRDNKGHAFGTYNKVKGGWEYAEDGGAYVAQSITPAGQMSGVADGAGALAYEITEDETVADIAHGISDPIDGITNEIDSDAGDVAGAVLNPVGALGDLFRDSDEEEFEDKRIEDLPQELIDRIAQGEDAEAVLEEHFGYDVDVNLSTNHHSGFGVMMNQEALQAEIQRVKGLQEDLRNERELLNASLQDDDKKAQNFLQNCNMVFRNCQQGLKAAAEACRPSM